MNNENPQQERHEVSASTIPPTVVDENNLGLVPYLLEMDKNMGQIAAVFVRPLPPGKKKLSPAVDRVV